MSESNIDTSSTKLIVNYLPQMMDDNELYCMFKTVGPLQSCRVMRDFKTNYSFGFGFVTYIDPKDAEKAIQRLNGLAFLGKRLKVSFARKSSDSIKETNLYITQIPRNFNSDDLKTLFEPYGTIVQMNLLHDKVTGMSKGVGFVRFSLNKEAENAIKNLDGISVDGSSDKLRVRVAQEDGKMKAAYYAGLHAGLLSSRARGQATFRRNCGGVMRQRGQQRFNPMIANSSPAVGYRGRQGHYLNSRYGTDRVNKGNRGTQDFFSFQDNTDMPFDPMTFGYRFNSQYRTGFVNTDNPMACGSLPSDGQGAYLQRQREMARKLTLMME